VNGYVRRRGDQKALGTCIYFRLEEKKRKGEELEQSLGKKGRKMNSLARNPGKEVTRYYNRKGVFRGNRRMKEKRNWWHDCVRMGNELTRFDKK